MSEVKQYTAEEREILKNEADLLGISYQSNISTVKLAALIAESKTDVVEEVEEPVAEVKVKTEVSTKPVVKTRAEMDPHELRRDLTRLIRCVVSCNDPAMKEWDMTPYYSLSNSKIKLPRITVPLNVEWHIPLAYVELMKNMICYIPVKSKDEKGRKITIRKEIKKYNIQELPPLTEKELAELKQAQLMRDGIK